MTHLAALRIDIRYPARFGLIPLEIASRMRKVNGKKRPKKYRNIDCAWIRVIVE